MSSVFLLGDLVMSLYFTKNGEPFVPESINPDLVKLSLGIIKVCHLKVKYQMRTSSLLSVLKTADSRQMRDTVFKCIEKNKSAYNQDMSLTGVKIAEVDDAFFADKDDEFFKATLKLLVDFAAINTVVGSNFLSLLGVMCEKQTGTPINKTLFFTNQTDILDDEEIEEAE